MQIKVNCICGKVLKIPSQYAGKKGRCPHCGKKIAIPSLDEIKNRSAIGKEHRTSNCPTCGAHLNPDDKVCVSCRTDLSTGEWDLRGEKIAAPHDQSTYANIMVIVAALLLGGGIFLVLRALTAPVPLRNATSLPSVPKENKLEAIMDLPETTLANLSNKICTLQNGLHQELDKPLLEKYQQLKRKKRELQIEKHYKNPKADVDLVQWDMEKMQQLSSTNQSQLLLHNSKWAPSLLARAYSHDIQQEIATIAQSMEKQLQEIDANLHSQELARRQTQRLTIFQNRSNKFFSAYRQKLRSWKFDKLLKQMQPLFDEAKHLSENFPQDSQVKKIIATYEDLSLLKKFGDIAHEALTSLVGQNKNLPLRNHSIATGKIAKIDKQKLYLQTTRESELQPIAIADLSAKTLADIVLQHNQQAKTYMATAMFYRINDKARACNEACLKAVQLGISCTAISKCHKWSQQILDARKQSIIQQRQTQQQAMKDTMASAQQRVLAAQRNKAWHIINRLLNDYRNGNDEQVFGHLYALKQVLPQEELAQLNTIVHNREGQSLTTIATVVFNHCPYCRNSETGSIKCPQCIGEGYRSEGVGSDVVPLIKKHCVTCRGSGEIACPKCYTKRHNRRNIRLLAFYKNL